MKFNSFVISAMSALLLFSSCHNGSEEISVSSLSEMKVFADYKNLSWSEGTAISVFDGFENHRFTAVVSGESSEFISGGLIDDSARELYALYPYSEKAQRTESGLEVSFQAEQDVTSADMDVNACKAVAYEDEFIENIVFSFNDLCSYFKFSVASEDKIVQVMLSGDVDESLAGTFEVTYSEEEPQINVLERADAVTLKSSVPMDGIYVACVLPSILQNGLSLKFTAQDGSVVEKKVIARNDAGNVEALVFARGRMNKAPIVFEDLFESDIPDTPDPDVPVNPDDPDDPVVPDPDQEIFWNNNKTDSYVLNDVLDLWI